MKLINLALTLCAITLIGLIAGCAASLAPQTQSQIAQIRNQSAIDQAKAKAADARNELNGQEKPATHPIAAADEIIREIRPYLIALLLLSFTAWAVLFGLSFTAFSFASFLCPVFRWVWILSASALIALPFLPLGLLVILAALVGLFIFELVKAKGNLALAFDDTEATLGFSAPASSSSVTTSPTSAAGLSALATDLESRVEKLL